MTTANIMLIYVGVNYVAEALLSVDFLSAVGIFLHDVDC